MSLSVAVVLLSYNSSRHLEGCFNSFRQYASEEIRHRFIVVDSGSSVADFENTVAIMQRIFGATGVATLKLGEPLDGVARTAEAVVIRSDENLGYSRGNNVGFKAARELGIEFGLLANPDTQLLDKVSLPALVRVLHDDKMIFAAFPRVQGPDGKFDGSEQGPYPRFSAMRLILGNKLPDRVRSFFAPVKRSSETSNAPVTIYTAIGCFIAFRVKTFLQLGGLDEAFFLYLEEFVLGEKARQNGFRNVQVPGAQIIHLHDFRHARINLALFEQSFELLLKKYLGYSDRGLKYIRKARALRSKFA